MCSSKINGQMNDFPILVCKIATQYFFLSVHVGIYGKLIFYIIQYNHSIVIQYQFVKRNRTLSLMFNIKMSFTEAIYSFYMNIYNSKLKHHKITKYMQLYNCQVYLGQE